jgi:hypothetical protein
VEVLLHPVAAGARGCPTLRQRRECLSDSHPSARLAVVGSKQLVLARSQLTPVLERGVMGAFIDNGDQLDQRTRLLV